MRHRQSLQQPEQPLQEPHRTGIRYGALRLHSHHHDAKD